MIDEPLLVSENLARTLRLRPGTYGLEGSRISSSRFFAGNATVADVSAVAANGRPVHGGRTRDRRKSRWPLPRARRAEGVENGLGADGHCQVVDRRQNRRSGQRSSIYVIRA